MSASDGRTSVYTSSPMNGTRSMMIAQAGFAARLRSRRRKTSISART